MCVKGYGFPVNRLFDLLFEVRDQYSETLLKKWAGVFRWDSFVLLSLKLSACLGRGIFENTSSLKQERYCILLDGKQMGNLVNIFNCV